MKTEDIRNGFEPMTPDQKVKDRMLGNILSETEKLRRSETGEKNRRFISSRGFRWAAAVLCLTAIAVLIAVTDLRKHSPAGQLEEGSTGGEEYSADSRQSEVDTAEPPSETASHPQTAALFPDAASTPGEQTALSLTISWLKEHEPDVQLLDGKVISEEEAEDKLWAGRLLRNTGEEILMAHSYYVVLTYGTAGHYDASLKTYFRKIVRWDDVFYVGYSDAGEFGQVMPLQNGLKITDTVSITQDVFGEPFTAERCFSHYYTEEEIKEAKTAAEACFEENFYDCSLWDIWYPGDEENDAQKEAFSFYNKDEIMVLFSDFENGPDASASFGGSLQSSWMWVMGRDKGGTWEVLSWGY